MPDYQNIMILIEGRVVFTIPPEILFEEHYKKIFTSVSDCTARIRNLEVDLDFTVRSAGQERDFKIYKAVSV